MSALRSAFDADAFPVCVVHKMTIASFPVPSVNYVSNSPIYWRKGSGTVIPTIKKLMSHGISSENFKYSMVIRWLSSGISSFLIFLN